MEALRPGDPERIGAYRLEGRLGAGGMGQVFLGRTPGGRPVAVKLVHAPYGHDEGFRRRFAQEVEAARRVGGFFTAQVVDADPYADRPWVVSAFVPGPTLQAAVTAHGPLPTATLRVLAAGLAEGLSVIHECALVHRDLKPGNVILAADGPRIIDFGIARALDATAHSTTGAVRGTPAYMSPEQARGNASVTTASDVFSLGSVLAFASTGTSPFDGEGPAVAVMYRITQEEPDLSGTDNELRGLVAACLAKDPTARPTTADIMRAFTGTGTDRDWLPEPVTTMVRDAAAPADAGPGRPVGPQPPPRRRGLSRLAFRRGRPTDPLPAAPAPADASPTGLEEGWNGLPWGATVAQFRARFPKAHQRDEWWLTGTGPEAFCGIEMHTQYSFNGRGELGFVAFIPEVKDRDRLSVAVLNALGAPDDATTTWTRGDVVVEVKVAGLIATLTHRVFGAH
ncbi:serine/threonine-protein kinase [Kitasatospora sp. NPDC036755]|uniref:serine/threonine-protein kinase n=1 Tax=Kitasatospora sp. NPDC036755 TaxID=3154600 RepID=UPI0033FDC4DE